MSFQNAVIEANKGHLHCYISPPIIRTIIIILQAASSLCIIFNYDGCNDNDNDNDDDNNHNTTNNINSNESAVCWGCRFLVTLPIYHFHCLP